MKQGTVVKWDDARGFGFIRSAGPGGDIFFHVRDFRTASGTAPRLGLSVTFEEIHIGGKGPRAMAVQPVGEVVAPTRTAAPARPRHTGEAPASGAFFALPLMAAYAGALVWGVYVGRLPWWVLPLAFVLNLFTFYAYWLDKWAAGRGQWRTSEQTLHAFSTVGGWAGAWFAQQVLRHKSRKLSFRITYWTTVVLHCGALGGWLAAAV